jgi:hypothetical protein
MSKRWMLAAAAALSTCAAHAAREADPANAIGLLTPVTYESTAGVNAALKEDCDIPAEVQSDMQEAMQHQRVGGKQASSLADGKVLKVTIANVRGSDGGGWTGAKVLSLQAVLFENGKELGHSRFTSETMGPNPFKGACSTLRRVTEKLSRIIVKWARDPRSVAPTPTPVAGEASTETEAASGAMN